MIFIFSIFFGKEHSCYKKKDSHFLLTFLLLAGLGPVLSCMILGCCLSSAHINVQMLLVSQSYNQFVLDLRHRQNDENDNNANMASIDSNLEE